VKRVNVEHRGIEPVPTELRTTGGWDLFAILFMGQMNPALIVLGALAVIVGDLSWGWALVSGTIGYGAAGLILVVLAQVGVDYGVPGQVALRATFGVRGSRIFTSPLRIVTGVYWFAAQAFASALAVAAVAKGLGVGAPRAAVLGVTIGCAQASIALVGFHGLRAAARPSVPSGLALAGIFLYLLDGLPSTPSVPGHAFTWPAFAAFTSVFCGGGLSNVTNIADVCRYSRSRTSMRVGFLSGTIVGTAVAVGIGAYAASRTDSKNPFAFAEQVHGETVLLVLLALLILVQATAINSMNLYTAGMSLVNAVPILGRVRATAVISVCAIALSGVPSVVTQGNQWVSWLGCVTAPIAGVLLGDYVILRRMHLDVERLIDPGDDPQYASGVSIPAIVAVGVGTAVYALVPAELVRAAWGVASACVVFLCLRRVWRPLAGALRSPVVLRESED
jgi:NCS1 nucleoside transporter family